jgi:hypothetical protein
LYQRPGQVRPGFGPNQHKKGEIMKLHQPHWFAAILLGSALALPAAVLAAEKGDMMKDDKGKMMTDEKAKMMKEETGAMLKDGKSGMMKDDKAKMMKGAVKDQKSKAKTSAEKTKMDKMDEMKK